MGIWTDFMILKDIGFLQKFYLGFSKKSKKVILAEKFSKAMIEFKKSDEYKNILKKYKKLK